MHAVLLPLCSALAPFLRFRPHRTSVAKPRHRHQPNTKQLAWHHEDAAASHLPLAVEKGEEAEEHLEGEEEGIATRLSTGSVVTFLLPLLSIVILLVVRAICLKEEQQQEGGLTLFCGFSDEDAEDELTKGSRVPVAMWVR